MTRDDLVVFLIQISVMLAVGLALGKVMCRLRTPAVVGELIGGVLLGPTVLGAVAPSFHAWLFPSQGISSVGQDAVIQLGMLFFLFLAGLEVNLEHLRRQGLSIALVSISGIAVPFALGFGSVFLLPDLWGDQANGDTLITALFVGTALSISALPVTARILLDLNLIRSEAGRVMMAAATINDLIGWSLFAVILSKATPNATPTTAPWATMLLVLGLFALVLSLGRRVGRHALFWLQSHLTGPASTIGAMAVALLSASAVVQAMGMHTIVGAFLAGVCLSEDCERRNQAHETVYQFAMGFFAPICFVSIGLKTNFLANCDPPLVLFVFLVAFAGKVIPVTLGARVGGLPLREALAVGFGMNARGAMEVILATVAFEHNLIDQSIFVALVIMAVVTSLLSGTAVQRLLRPADVSTGDRRSLNVAPSRRKPHLLLRWRQGQEGTPLA
ncbi:MAG: cation:proton antiporter [Bacillota bacterium]